jgi:hypothetical protein
MINILRGTSFFSGAIELAGTCVHARPSLSEENDVISIHGFFSVLRIGGFACTQVPATVIAWINARQLPAARIGHTRIIPAAPLQQRLAGHRAKRRERRLPMKRGLHRLAITSSPGRLESR